MTQGYEEYIRVQREKRTNKKLKKLSNLEETSKDLAARVEQYDADAKELEEREGDLSKEQTILDRRENALLGQNRRFVRASSSELSWTVYCASWVRREGCWTRCSASPRERLPLDPRRPLRPSVHQRQGPGP